MSGASAIEPIGVVLAGGASRRMGLDKTQLDFDGTSLVEHAALKLRHCVSVVAIADRGRGNVLGYRSLQDASGGGPAAGILGAAQAFPGRDLLVLACDLPTVTSALLEGLRAASRDPYDIVAPRWSRGAEPLCACYRPAALAALDEQVHSGRFALQCLLSNDGLNPLFIEGSELAAYGSPEHLFLNLNTPADLSRLRQVTCEPNPTKID